MGDKLVYVALDYSSQQKNLEFAERLAKGVDSNRFGFKINLDSIADFSPEAVSPYSFVRKIAGLGKSVFVDLKMWNGGRTMENVAKGCVDLGVDIINMYPHAGRKFTERVVGALSGSQTKLFGLTVLTHYDDADTQRLYGKSLGDTVRMFAEMSRDYGASGIILPGTQLGVVKDLSLQKLCPGIRPSWFGDKGTNDQKEIVTPSQAVSGGADYIVVGSPIRKSEDSSQALERVIGEMT